MVKAVTLFLVVVLVLAMLGRLSLLLPKGLRPAKCESCGRHRIGKGACACGKS